MCVCAGVQRERSVFKPHLSVFIASNEISVVSALFLFTKWFIRAVLSCFLYETKYFLLLLLHYKSFILARKKTLVYKGEISVVTND